MTEGLKGGLNSLGKEDWFNFLNTYVNISLRTGGK